jgi:lysozyme
MQVSQAGIDLIKNWEGYRSHAYPDPGSGGEPYTIGYGTTVYPTGEKVRLGDTCTEEQALEWLRYDVSEFEEAVNESLTALVNQMMFDALVSLCYNIGAKAFKRSTLVKKLNEGAYLEAAEEFDRWNKASGRELPGLTRRRDAEQAMFNAGMDQALAFARDHTGFA